MPAIGELKREGEWATKYIWVKCPICLNERWMRLSNYRRGKETGLCLSCFNKYLNDYSRPRKGGSHRSHSRSKGHTHEGYVFVKYEGHPRASKEGFVKRAVLVMESKLGRHLSRQEHVHHINGKRDDDRLENLMILTNSEHARLHRLQHPNIKNRYQMQEN